jgi:hypothetical protein
MSGGTSFVGVDFPQELTSWIVFVAPRFDPFWCETGAVVIALFPCLGEASIVDRGWGWWLASWEHAG